MNNKDQFIVIVTAAAVVVLGGVAYFVVPWLQPAQTLVDLQAEQEAEKARRLLDVYSAEVDRIAQLSRQFDPAGQRLTAERIGAGVEKDSRAAEEALAAETTRANDQLKSYQSAVTELDQRFADLDGSEPPAARGRLAFGKNAPGMTKDMADGARQRSALVEANTKMLAEAVGAASEAANITDGDASGAANVAVARQKAAAILTQALAERRDLNLLQAVAWQALENVHGSAIQLAAVGDQLRLSENTDLPRSITAQRAAVAEVEQQLAGVDQQIEQVQATTNGLRTEIARQLAAADQARAAMAALERRGLQYEDPQALERFRAEFNRHAEIYRTAASAADKLQAGSLTNARLQIDENHAEGQFVPDPPSAQIGFEPGLHEYSRRLQALVAERDGLKIRLADQQASLKTLDQLRADRERLLADAQTRRDSWTAQLRTDFAAFQEAWQKASAASTKTAAALDKAATAFREAATAATERMNNLPELAPEAEELSPVKLLRGDKWLATQSSCQSADARLQAALVHYERFTLLQRALDILRPVDQQTKLEGLDLAALQTQADEAKADGIKLAGDAAGILERAGSDLRNHWTVAATLAAADYALALFGEPGMLDVATANYQAAVQGRETSPLVQPFVTRLEQLRAR